jgi:LPXTG-motif cell wall-anchored protein
MTQINHPAHKALRRATAMLLAAVALPLTAHAQETVAPPVVLAPAPAPAPAPTVQTPATGESRTTIAPGVVEQAQQEARERAAAQRAAPQRSAPAARPVTAARAAPAAPTATAATVPAIAPPAPSAETPAESAAVTPAPVAPAPSDPAATADSAPAAPQTGERGTTWLVLAGLGAVAAMIAALMLLRRRRPDEAYETGLAPETVAAAPLYDPEPEPVAAPHGVAGQVVAPAVAAPAFIDRPGIDRAAARSPHHEPEVHAALQNATLHRADSVDIDAVLGGAAPEGDRPQLELAMRPLRAGVTRNEGVVEFELTVANAGGVQAEDVRIGAFMLSGDVRDSAMERLLTSPPADAVVEADSIAPGDGTRVDAAVTLPRDDFHNVADGGGHEGFSPVVLADARYRLPDGSEGRTAAAFAIGRVNGGETLVPIDLEGGPAMYDDIEARLHSVPAKV